MKPFAGTRNSAQRLCVKKAEYLENDFIWKVLELATIFDHLGHLFFSKLVFFVPVLFIFIVIIVIFPAFLAFAVFFDQFCATLFFRFKIYVSFL